MAISCVFRSAQLLRAYPGTVISRTPALCSRYASSNSNAAAPKAQAKSTGCSNKAESDLAAKPKKKTMAELDAELMQKMQGIAGDGGDAGIEYEDGQPVSMKRSVKNNMFRYI